MVDEVNRQVGSLQESTSRALGKSEQERDEGAEARQEQEDEPVEGVET